MTGRNVQPESDAPAANPPVSPHLIVDGALQAAAFYERAFGARLGQLVQTPDGSVLHAELILPSGGAFYIMDHRPEIPGSREPRALGGTPVTIHLDVPDVDAVFQQALAAGAEVEMELADQFWGDRYGQIRDPFGHRWSLATQKRVVSQAELEQAVRQMSA